MNLYEIDNRILSCIDDETGEILDEQMIADLEMERDKKIENIACWIKNLNAEAAALKAEKDSLAKRQKSAENKAESLKRYLGGYLAGQPFKSARAAVSFRKSEQLEIDEGAKIPKKYLKIADPTIDKAGLKNALKTGLLKRLKGVQIVEHMNIQIK